MRHLLPRSISISPFRAADRFRGGNLHRRKTRSYLLNRSSLPAPGEHHARRNAIAAANLCHLRSWR
jgi:hypothetical protein